MEYLENLRGFLFYIKGVLALSNYCVLKIVVFGLRVILGMMEDGHGSPIQIPPFLKSTYEIVEDSLTNSIVSWSANGRSFIVSNLFDFEKDVLPRYFKHNNFSSFNRELNTYVSNFNVLHIFLDLLNCNVIMLIFCYCVNVVYLIFLITPLRLFFIVFI